MQTLVSDAPQAWATLPQVAAECQDRGRTSMRCAHRLLAAILMASLIAADYSFAVERDARVEVWIRRTVECAAAAISDANQSAYDKEFCVAIASLALGEAGCVSETLQFFDEAGLEEDSRLRQQGLSSLADGLASGDHVAEALKIAEVIENEYLRGTAYSLVTIRQSQRGDFQDAEALHSQLPTQVSRDRAAKQISSEYAQAGRYDDARRLARDISDADTRIKILKEIDTRGAQPSVKDEGYIDFQLEHARNRPMFSASSSELEFLKHFYKAEVALAVNDQAEFEREARSARQLAETMKEHGDGDGALLLLGRLMYEAGSTEDARQLYALLLRKYATEEDSGALDFNKLMFGSGTNSDATKVADCMPPEEVRDLLNDLLKVESAAIVAAPLFGAVVRRRDPSWADKMYDTIADPKVKASVASHCLLALAEQNP